MLLGRRPERVVLDGLLDAVRAGESRALVVRGDLGIGKSALLDHLAMRAADCEVIYVAAVQPELELAFAYLHQACTPNADRFDTLPEPQRDALTIALGMRSGPPPDRFRVGLAVLSLLSEVATDRPLVWIVDDAPWVDRASLQAIAFAARRLRREAVAIVFGTRPPGPPELAGCRRSTSPAFPTTTRGSCCGPCCPGRWTNRCATAWSPRPGATRWPCWSCGPRPATPVRRRCRPGSHQLPPRPAPLTRR
ncbi:ATP-binding protein [Asanoa sp. NPDC049518]|uniref:ATP-binding protein n=1 Tax=unclassified Asanoa TaxID=2685164 RepID=UPI0034344974